MVEEEVYWLVLEMQQPNPKDNFKRWDDPLYNDLRRIFSRVKLREVMTHSSFYEQEGKGNSRLVFAGMYVFRGQVAEVLFRYATGEGTRLQHLLGNMFRNERLERMFDEWRLWQFARAGEKLPFSATYRPWTKTCGSGSSGNIF